MVRSGGQEAPALCHALSSHSGSEPSLDSALWRGYLRVGAGTSEREFVGRGRARLSTFHDNDLQRKELTEESSPHTLPVGTAPALPDPKSRKVK